MNFCEAQRPRPKSSGVRAALLVLLALLMVVAALLTATDIHADEPDDAPTTTNGASLASPFAALSNQAAAPALGFAATFSSELSGRVYVWSRGRLRPVSHARVSTGTTLVRTDENGRFDFQPGERTGQLSIVHPGYDVVRRPIYFDQSVIVLRSLVVRAIYVPFARIDRDDVQRYIHELVDADLINAVVLDIKDEAGQVAPFAATETVRRLGAHSTAKFSSVPNFLQELGDKGVYRIGRIVTFLDPWFAAWHPADALHNLQGGTFTDASGQGWASPFSWNARRYNIEIGVAAAAYVEEIQYDYVRLPYEPHLLERRLESDRIASINRFAQEAGEALHLAGVAVSFDTFGVVSTAGNDQGIGQSVPGVASHIDYVSPMVYPSGWQAGSFGLAYPPEHPGSVVRQNVQATVDLIVEDGAALVRPWLQDFTDYQSRGLHYNAERVHAQIEAASQAGGIGFMLWDPSLQYQRDALERALQLHWTPQP